MFMIMKWKTVFRGWGGEPGIQSAPREGKGNNKEENCSDEREDRDKSGEEG